MKFILFVISSLLIIFFTGCSTSVERMKIESNLLPKKFSIQGDHVLQKKWWEVFNDVELNNLIEKALSTNLTLQATWERLTQAKAIAVKSGVSLYPSVNLSGDVSSIRNNGSTNSFSTTIAAGYEFDLWGRLSFIADASALDVKASKEDLLSASISLSAEVASIWYKLKEQHAHAKLLRNQLRINEKHLKITERKFKNAQSKASDVLQQRQVLESVKGETVLTQGRIKLFENQLSLLLGEKSGVLNYSKDSSLPILKELPSLGIPSELLMQRPDVKSAYFSLEAYNLRLGNAISERYPKFSISVSSSSRAVSASDLFTNWLVTLAGNMSAPIFDAGLRYAEVKRSEAKRDEQLYKYKNVLLSALKEVEDGLSKVVHQEKYVHSLSKQVELSTKSLAQIKDQYIHGNNSFVSFLNAQLSYEVLERNKITATRELIDNRISLYRSLSTGWNLKRNNEIKE